MKVLFVSRNFFPEGVVGGAQLCIKHLADGLERLGHEVAVLSLDNHAHCGPHALYGFPEYRLRLRHRVPKARSFGLLKGVWHAMDRFGGSMEKDYRNVIEDFSPDVINTNVMAGVGTRFWQVAQEAGVPVVHTVYDYYLLCIRSSMRANGANCSFPCMLCRTAALWPSRKAATAVSHVIYVSQHMRHAHEDAGVFPSNTASSVLGEAYTPQGVLPKRKGLLREGTLTLGFFGRISPEKGLEQLLEALRSYRSNQWNLRVGGKGDNAYVQRIQAIAKGLPVTFLGVQDPSGFYSSVDAIVVPSLWHDPAPRVAFEAGIHGAVPIVSGRGGLSELVAGGKLGLIFDVDDSASLHRTLDILLKQDTVLEEFRNAWIVARDSFDPKAVARATLDVYEQVVR